MVPASARRAESGQPARPAHPLARVPAPTWVVAGAPGAGKSTVATLLLAAVRQRGHQVPALLDKDTLYGDFVKATLELAGRSRGEREGVWYDAHIKSFEYGGMTAAAREITAHGCPALLCGPFTQQIRSRDVWGDWLGDLGGGPVTLVYVRTDAETLAVRLADRSSPRDDGKRADFEGFVARMTPDVSPPVPHLEIDNRGSAALPLPLQIEQLVISGELPLAGS
jgi:hypothetical protein